MNKLSIIKWCIVPLLVLMLAGCSGGGSGTTTATDSGGGGKSSYYSNYKTSSEQSLLRKKMAAVLFGYSDTDAVSMTNTDNNDYGNDSDCNQDGYRGGHAGIDVQTTSVAGANTATEYVRSISDGEFVRYIEHSYGVTAIVKAKLYNPLTDSTDTRYIHYLHLRNTFKPLVSNDPITTGTIIGIQGSLDPNKPNYNEHVHIEISSSDASDAQGANPLLCNNKSIGMASVDPYPYLDGLFNPPVTAAIPSRPSQPTVDATAPDSIAFSWNPVSSTTPVVYDIYRDGNYLERTISSQYTDSGLSPNTMHSYAVAACNITGCSSQSQSLSVSTTSLSTPIPAKPSQPAASVLSSSSIGLSWSSVPGATSYNVYRSGTNIISNGSTSFTDTGLSPNTTYSYTISACNGTGCSAQSQSISATTSSPAPSISSAAVYNFNSSSQTFSSGLTSWNNIVVVIKGSYLASTSVVNVPGLSCNISAPLTSSNFSKIAFATSGAASYTTSTGSTKTTYPSIDGYWSGLASVCTGAQLNVGATLSIGVTSVSGATPFYSFSAQVH